MNKILKNIRDCIGVMVITLLVLAAAMAADSMWPFGDKSMLLWDMEIQYINIYNWFWDVLHGSASLFYDFSKSLGGNMFGIYGLYLASPINLLLYFFPKEKVIYFITFATLLKICLSGATAQIYISCRFPQVKTIWRYCIAISFALMEYNVGLCSNLHFLDDIVVLPLVALGAWLFMEKDKKFLYCISLGFCIFCDWYVAFMICVFLVIYYFLELSWSDEKRTFGQMIVLTVRFGIYSIIGVMIGAVTFLPSILSSTNGKGAMDWSELKLEMHCSYLAPLKAFLPVSQSNVSYEEPAIYVGGLVLILILMGIFDRRVSLRKKIAGLLALAFIFWSFSFLPWEMVWTALKKTHSFYFRHAFVFSFLLCAVAAMTLDEAAKKKEKMKFPVLLGGILLAAGYAALVVLNGDDNLKKHVLYVGLLLAYMAGCYLYETKEQSKLRVIAALAVLVLLSAELEKNTQLAFARYRVSISGYTGYEEMVEAEIDEITEADTSFYRLEKTFSEMDERRGSTRPVATEGLTFNYNAITHYSTLYDSTVTDFLTTLGYAKANAMSTNYVGTNPLADSLLGVRYLLSEREVPLMEKTGEVTTATGTAGVYYNACALNFATAVAGDTFSEETGDDPFANQEQMLSQMLGEETSVYHALEYDKDGSSWTIRVDADGPVYAYFGADQSDREVYVNGEYLETYFGRFYKNVMCLGTYSAGDTITLTLKDDEDCTKDHKLSVCRVDEDEYISCLQKLQQNSVEPSSFTDTDITVSFTADSEQTLLLSVPYDEGWSITIDGRKADYEEAFGALIAVKVPAGTSEIEMKYTPPYLTLSAMVSAAGVILLLVGILIGKRKELKK